MLRIPGARAVQQAIAKDDPLGEFFHRRLERAHPFHCVTQRGRTISQRILLARGFRSGKYTIADFCAIIRRYPRRLRGINQDCACHRSAGDPVAAKSAAERSVSW